MVVDAFREVVLETGYVERRSMLSQSFKSKRRTPGLEWLQPEQGAQGRGHTDEAATRKRLAELGGDDGCDDEQGQVGADGDAGVGL